MAEWLNTGLLVAVLGYVVHIEHRLTYVETLFKGHIGGHLHAFEGAEHVGTARD